MHQEHNNTVIHNKLKQLKSPGLLWPPCVADADIIFLPCDFYFFLPRLISAVGDWMSTILPHMVWP